MYHGAKKRKYKFSVSGKWVNNNSNFSFGFMTKKSAENWAKKNNLERFAYWHLITEKPEDESINNK